MPMPLTPGQRTLPTQRAAEAPPPEPGDFFDQVGDGFQDTRADTTGYVEQVQLDAYKPIIHALEDEGYAFTAFVNPRSGTVSPESVWRAVEKARKASPGAFADLPATVEEFETQWREKERDRIAAVRARTAEGGWFPTLLGGIGGAMTDPVNIYALPVGGFGKTLGQRLLTEGLVNAGLETALQPVAQGNREKLGLPDLTLREAGANIVFAGVGAAALRGGFEMGPTAARKLADNVAGDWQRTRDYVWPRLPQAVRDRFGSKEAMQLDDLPDVAEEVIGRDRMTQTERDAVEVMRDEQELARSPFKPNGAGEELHADMVGEALDALIDLPFPSPELNRIAAPELPSRAFEPATDNFMEPTISRSGRLVYEPTVETADKAQFYLEFTPEGADAPINAQVTLTRESGEAIVNVNTDKIGDAAAEANTLGGAQVRRMLDELIEAFPDIRSIEGDRVTGAKAGSDASQFSLNERQVDRLRQRGTTFRSASAEARFMDRVRSAESSGDDAAKNPRSSATGRYQFIDSTWIRQYVKRYGRGGLTDDQILAKRTNGAIQDQLMRDLTAENAEFLRRQGEAVSEGNLYLVHFSGAGGAKKVFDADPTAPIESVWSAEVIAANPFLKGMTAGDVISWAHRKMGQKGNSPRAGAGYELTEEASGLDGALAREAEELATIRRTLDEAYTAQDAARRAAQGEQDSDAVQTALNSNTPARAFDDGEAFDEADFAPREELAEGETPEQAALRSGLADLAHDTKESLNDMAALARRFEASEDEIRGALDGMVARGTLTQNRKTGNYMRKPGSDPDELLETVARLGGLRDDEGNGLGLNDLSARERRELDSNAQRNTRRNRKARGSRDWNKIMTRAGPLLRHEGRSVDQIGEGLWEAGWFTERPTTSQVLDLLENRIGKGEKMYPPGRGKAKAEAFDPDAETKLRSDWEEAEAAFRSEFTLGKAFDGTLDDMPDEAIMGRAAEIYRESGGEVDAETAVVKALDEEYERVLEDLALQDMEAEYGKRFDIFDPEWLARLDERIEQRRGANGEGGSRREGFAGDARARGEGGGGAARSGADAVDPKRLAELSPEQRAPFSDPDGPAAKQQADSLVHDMRANRPPLVEEFDQFMKAKGRQNPPRPTDDLLMQVVEADETLQGLARSWQTLLNEFSRRTGIALTPENIGRIADDAFDGGKQGPFFFRARMNEWIEAARQDMEPAEKALRDIADSQPATDRSMIESGNEGFTIKVDGAEIVAGIDEYGLDLKMIVARDGAGTQAMETLTQAADEHGVIINLYARNTGEGEAPTSKLVEWYERFGFENVEGRVPTKTEEADPDHIGVDMTREPKGETEADAPSLDNGAQVDPAIAARQASEAQLRAEAPMRGANVTGQEQDGTMGLGLFDAADQPEFLLDADGPGTTAADLLAELDKGEADLKSIRDCL